MLKRTAGGGFAVAPTNSSTVQLCQIFCWKTVFRVYVTKATYLRSWKIEPPLCQCLLGGFHPMAIGSDMVWPAVLKSYKRAMLIIVGESPLYTCSQMTVILDVRILQKKCGVMFLGFQARLGSWFELWDFSIENLPEEIPPRCFPLLACRQSSGGRRYFATTWAKFSPFDRLSSVPSGNLT